MDLNPKKSLRDLLVARGQGGSSKEAPKSQVRPKLPPPPSQVLVNLGLKPLAVPTKNRPIKVLEEGELGTQKGTKQ